jgi:hypothetical protein
LWRHGKPRCLPVETLQNLASLCLAGLAPGKVAKVAKKEHLAMLAILAILREDACRGAETNRLVATDHLCYDVGRSRLPVGPARDE